MSTTEASTTAQNPLTDLNTGFLRDMLTVISTFDERPSGQQIRERMENIGGYDTVNHGKLYPNLDRLVENGYVVKGEIDRRTNFYRISEKGEEALEEYSEFVAGE